MFFRRKIIFAGILLIAFLLVTALSFFLISGEKSRSLLLAEYRADRIASALLDAFRENQTLSIENEEEILGFGIYDLSGKAVTHFGTAPPTYDLSDESSSISIFRFDRDRKTLVLIRKMGLLPGRLPDRMPEWGPGKTPPGNTLPGRIPGPMPGNMPRRMRRMMNLHAEPSQFLFLELSAEGHWTSQRLYSFAFAAVPLAVAAILGAIAYLYRKNLSYREKLESQTRLAQLGETARTLSHEIKNPLSAIRIRTGILKKVLPEAQLEDLQVIEEEVQHLTSLTDRIGDYLRDPVGRPEIINLNGFLQDLLARFNQDILYTPADRISVRFDRERLRSVLENLIRNALESTPAGDPSEQSVEVHVSSSKSKVTISVMDRGEGISPEIRERIFDPFYTSKTTGSGIGLAIARSFVESAGGSLSLSPRSGGGTVAEVCLKSLKRESNEDTGR